MKLFVPYFGSLLESDANLIRVAGFLGVSAEALPLNDCAGRYVDYLQKIVPVAATCFVINPATLENWTGSNFLPAELVAFLKSRFQQLLVHGMASDAKSSGTIEALSEGALHSPRAIASDASYEIAARSEDICGPFTGLSFGPANPASDCVFSSAHQSEVRKLITIGGETFMAAVPKKGTEIIVIGSRQVANLDAELSDNVTVVDYFSRLLPHAMALRHFFGESSWRPCSQLASVIIDDPLLQPSYGFLQFESLLNMTRSNNFQATIAFIPHNWRRSSAQTVGIFRSSQGRLSLCFHGNDHTGAEFAATDPMLLNTMLHTAKRRMAMHTRRTGLSCDRIMVFPQGKFSVEAMEALRHHNFDAAVNTVHHPVQQRIALTLAERAQPAVLRYAGFPLFLRKKSTATQGPEIAFNLFFGIPILIVEHHDIFENPQPLLDAVARINAIAPGISWCSAGAAVNRSLLRRRGADGCYSIRTYSYTAQVSNGLDTCQQLHIEWNHHDGIAVKHVLRNGETCDQFENNNMGTTLAATLEPGCSGTFSVVWETSNPSPIKFGMRYKTRAFVRRRLSEIRDNYISRSPSMLATARALQRRLGAKSI